MTDWIIYSFAVIGAEAVALLICWVLAGIWVRVFPR
jgi:hypothetical protein